MQEARQYYAIAKRDAYAELCALIRGSGFSDGGKQIAEALLKAEPDHPHACAVIARHEQQREQRRMQDEAAKERAEKEREEKVALERRLLDLTRIIWFGDQVDPWTRDRQKFYAARGEKLATLHDVEPPLLPNTKDRLWCVAQDMTGLVHLLLVDLRAVPPHGLRPIRAMQRDVMPLSWKSIENWKRWSTFMPFFNTPGKAWNAAEIALKEQNMEGIANRIGI